VTRMKYLHLSALQRGKRSVAEYAGVSGVFSIS
jgi:hypothetical protein